jgi:hypothetical protein
MKTITLLADGVPFLSYLPRGGYSHTPYGVPEEALKALSEAHFGGRPVSLGVDPKRHPFSSIEEADGTKLEFGRLTVSVADPGPAGVPCYRPVTDFSVMWERRTWAP